jgi:hypothetical protein
LIFGAALGAALLSHLPVATASADSLREGPRKCRFKKLEKPEPENANPSEVDKQGHSQGHNGPTALKSRDYRRCGRLGQNRDQGKPAFPTHHFVLFVIIVPPAED